MKTTGIILSVLGVGLLVTGIVILVNQKKSEKTSGIDGDSDCGCSNATGQACVKPKVWNGWTCVDKVTKGNPNARATNSKLESKSNACGCGM